MDKKHWDIAFPMFKMIPISFSRDKAQRYEDTICQSTAIANCVEPKAQAVSVGTPQFWKCCAEGEIPKCFAICQGTGRTVLATI